MDPSAEKRSRDAFSAQIIDADSEARSWREKLAWVRDLLLSDAFHSDVHHLAELAVYLRFVGTGAIHCEEDGGHHRPSRHAKMAAQIHARLANLRTDSLDIVLRRIYPWLPSFDSDFTRPEPLTRIRDIAHRNDIPQQLKKEIKHTLQNKLHRCAGPEDLATSAALLERITADDAKYSADFVEQFELFHEELRRFFGAWSAVELLRDLAESADAPQPQLLLRLIEQLERPTGQRLEDLGLSLTLLRDLTAVRETMARSLPDSEESERQRLLRLDLALEEQAFVVLSAVANQLEHDGDGMRWWAAALEALTLAVQHAVLSAVQPHECAAIRSELECWRQAFDPDSRDDLLRLQATVQRCERVCAHYANAVLDLFAKPARRLGPKLGVAEHTIATYCEADLRANVVFQLSRLSASLTTAIQDLTGSTGWAPIVTGTAHGHVRVVDGIGDIDPATQQRAILLLRRAQGDEDLPQQVSGIVLAHQIPLLSHLGVRARQYGVPLVGCVDGARFEQLASDLRDQPAVLRVEATRATVSIAEAPQSPPKRPVVTPPTDRQPELVTADPVAALLGDGETPPAGGKAAGLVRLVELERTGACSFRTPETLVVPLGVMEWTLARNLPLKRTYELLVHRLDGADPPKIETISQQLVRVVDQLDIPPQVVQAVRDVFPGTARVMVRSSANSEDTAASAGAGRYISVANVPVARVARAIRRVWASLWSCSAIISRQREGLSQRHCQMGVLIQRMLEPELSFVIHTVDPLSGRPDMVCAELSVGLGETLVSGATPGTPFRLVCSKTGGSHQMQAFSGFSTALRPKPNGGLESSTVDHSQVRFACDASYRAQVASRLTAIAESVERHFGRPQDIEGVIAAEQVYLVQSRDQQGLAPPRQPSSSADTRASAKRPSAKAKGTKPPRQEPRPLHLLALFDRLIDGDDALLRLAGRQLGRHGLGAELHPGSPDELEQLLTLAPAPPLPVVAHLPRHIDLLTTQDQQQIGEYAHRFKGRIHSLVVHDQQAMGSDAPTYEAALMSLDAQLVPIEDGPWLFVEYAVGHHPGVFVDFFTRLAKASRISACIDTGHVGIRHARQAFAQRHGQPEVCQLTPYDPDLPRLIDDVGDALQGCLDTVLEVIRPLGALGKPIHLHLHDGHPLWTHSPFGISDHLSFLDELPIPFEHQGRRSLPLMFGVEGLARIASTALQAAQPGQATMTLEIHPVAGRLPLGADAELFGHWSDLTHAEQMSYWLAVLVRNAEAVRSSTGP